MFQILYEASVSWPEDGPLQVQTPPLHLEIKIPPDSARRRANGYLARYAYIEQTD